MLRPAPRSPTQKTESVRADTKPVSWVTIRMVALPFKEPRTEKSLVSLSRIHVRGRLVKEEEFGLRRGRGRRAACVARKRGVVAVGQIGHVGGLEGAVDDGIVQGGVAAPTLAQSTHTHHLPDRNGKGGVVTCGLRHVADLRARVLGLYAEDRDAPSARAGEAEEELEHGRLAGAVRAYQGGELALVDMEARPIQHERVAVGERDIVEAEGNGSWRDLVMRHGLIIA